MRRWKLAFRAKVKSNIEQKYLPIKFVKRTGIECAKFDQLAAVTTMSDMKILNVSQ